MIHTKAYTHKLKVRTSNTKKYKVIRDIVIQKMTKQGSGCFIPDYGNAYYNPADKTKDPIGIITSLSPSKLGQYIGAISDEELKPMVAHLIKKFDIRVDSHEEYIRFVTFLQDIQDAHDNFTVGISKTNFTLEEFIANISVL